MDNRNDLLNEVFDLVRQRLTQKADSLRHFIERWHGSAGGIEGWFKVEFVAAIRPELMRVRTGSAPRGKFTGNSYPDLRLEKRGWAPIEVELKAATNWFLPLKQYHSRVLFFLLGSPSDSLESRRRHLETIGKQFDIARVSGGLSCHSTRPIDFLVGFVDLLDTTGRAV